MRLKMMGHCLIAAFAISVLVVSTASAEPPEYGRCKALTGGEFANKGCTKAAVPGKGKYEWYPAYIPAKLELTLPKPGFTLKLKAGTKAFWQTRGVKIVCSNVIGAGDVFREREAHVTTLTFEGCVSAGGACTTPGQAAGTIVPNPTQHLATFLGWLSQPSQKVGEDLYQTPPGREEMWLFHCAAGTFAALGIEGINDQGITPVTSGKMLSRVTMKWKSKATIQGNIQVPERFEIDGSGSCRCFQVSYEKPSGEFGSGDFIGLTMTLIQTNEEPVEINPVV
jgi:hypothetical protein